jgi:hypothetical protein
MSVTVTVRVYEFDLETEGEVLRVDALQGRCAHGGVEVAVAPFALEDLTFMRSAILPDLVKDLRAATGCECDLDVAAWVRDVDPAPAGTGDD